MTSRGPVRISIVNDYEIVVAGVVSLLAPFADRVEVVELDSRQHGIGDVDLVLYDTFGPNQGEVLTIPALMSLSGSAKVVIFSWDLDDDLVARSLAQGASGYLAKSLTGEQIVVALEQVHAGGPTLTPSGLTTDGIVEDAHGLSAREAEILMLITQGLTNRQIAERTYLSINSVKTYIRTGYKKIGVTTRPHAIIWGMTHRLGIDRGYPVGMHKTP